MVPLSNLAFSQVGVTMPNDKERLLALLEKKTTEHWEKTKEPWPLNEVAFAAKEEAIPYAEVIRPFRLRQFIESIVPPRVKVAIHPTIKARIGLIPNGQEYSYPPEPDEGKEGPPKAKRRIAVL